MESSITREKGGIGVLRNPVEDIDVHRKYAQQIDLEDIVGERRWLKGQKA